MAIAEEAPKPDSASAEQTETAVEQLSETPGSPPASAAAEATRAAAPSVTSKAS
jgi:hypothetical protein